jgi:hypothetical protein
MRASRLRKKSKMRFVTPPICLCDRRTRVSGHCGRALAPQATLFAGKHLASRASARRWLQASGQRSGRGASQGTLAHLTLERR